MQFTHPETGKVYDIDRVIGFAVFSDRKTEFNPSNFSVMICLHPEYEVAKKIYDFEVEKHKSDELQNEAKSVSLILRNSLGFSMEGLIVHKWTNY